MHGPLNVKRLVWFEILYRTLRFHIFQTFISWQCLEPLNHWVPNCYTLQQPSPLGGGKHPPVTPLGWSNYIIKCDCSPILLFSRFYNVSHFPAPIYNYIIFFLQLLLSFQSSSINPFSPISPLIHSAQLSLGLPRFLLPSGRHFVTSFGNLPSSILWTCKAVPLQAWSGPEGSRKLRLPDFMTTAQDGGKVVSVTHRPPLPPGNTPGTHFC